MIRRKLTLKRVDPWSVLKFGFVVNVALLLVGLLVFWILWFTIRRLGLIEQFCGSVGTIVLDLQECSVNGGNIFRTVLFLGVLGVVVQTGIVVFGAFLYNLIADLTGGLTFSYLDESGDAVLTSAKTSRSDEAAPRPAARSSTGGGSSGDGSSGATAGSVASGAAAGAAAAGAQRSGPSHDTGSFRPSGPPRAGEGTRPSSTASSPEADRSPGRVGDRPSSSPSDRPSSSPSDRPSIHDGASGPGRDRPPPRAPQDADRNTSGPASTPSPAPRSAADSSERGSWPGAGSERPDSPPRDDDEGDEDREPERPARPSGSSLWGDPTRSRE